MGKFQRHSRLITSTEFDAVFRDSRSSRDEIFTVLYRGNGLGYPRLGLAIARKRVHHAVDRNRLKRLVRESFRVAAPSLAGTDIVVMASDRAATADNARVAASLAQHWRRLGARADHSAKRPAVN